MIRGSTPTHIFTIPKELSDIISSLKVSYKQGSKIVLRKEKDDFTITGNVAETRLTSEETLMFSDSQPVKVQMQILTLGGDLLPSRVFTVDIGELLDDEVLK